MRPIDTTGELWEHENSNAMLQKMQAEVKAELKGENADVIHATIVEKWAEFCAKPQDQAAFLKEHLPTERNKYLAEAKEKRQAAVDAARPPIDPSQLVHLDAKSDGFAVAEFACPDCGMDCTSAAGLVSHKRTHD